jgi:hypothetical protein
MRGEIRRRAASRSRTDRPLALYVLAWSTPAEETDEALALLDAAAHDGDHRVREAAEAGRRRLLSVETARRAATPGELGGDE